MKVNAMDRLTCCSALACSSFFPEHEPGRGDRLLSALLKAGDLPGKRGEEPRQFAGLEVEIGRAGLGDIRPCEEGVDEEQAAGGEQPDGRRYEGSLEEVEVEYQVEAAGKRVLIQVGADELDLDSCLCGPDSRLGQPHLGDVDARDAEAVGGQKDAVAPLAAGNVQRPPAAQQPLDRFDLAGQKLRRPLAEERILGGKAAVPFDSVRFHQSAPGRKVSFTTKTRRTQRKP